MSSSNCLVISGVLGVLSVLLGAFGAHYLSLPPESANTYQTAVTYQFYHTLALFGVGLWMKQYNSSSLRFAAWGFFIGILFFSGSLYGLCLTGARFFGPITPLGGLAFMSAWAAVAVSAIKTPKSQ